MFAHRLISLALPRPVYTTAVFVAALLSVHPNSARAAAVDSALLDNFSDAQINSVSVPRVLVTDKQIGGHSQATQSCKDGVLTMHGDLDPARGQPAFVSLVSLLSPDGQPHDMSKYQGVRLRVKVLKGMLSVQVGTADITNYDYHTSAPLTRHPDAFMEVKVPFASMKRAWSEQEPINTKTVTSVNLVAVGMAKDSFAYEIDEIGFY